MKQVSIYSDTQKVKAVNSALVFKTWFGIQILKLKIYGIFYRGQIYQASSFAATQIHIIDLFLKGGKEI